MQTLILPSCKKSCVGFRLAHLHLTLANPKIQVKVVHFEYFVNEGRANITNVIIYAVIAGLAGQVQVMHISNANMLSMISDMASFIIQRNNKS